VQLKQIIVEQHGSAVMEDDVQLLHLTQQRGQDVHMKGLSDASTIFEAGFHGVADAQAGSSCQAFSARDISSHAPPHVHLTYGLVGPMVQSALLMVDTHGSSAHGVRHMQEQATANSVSKA
jgi:hypothetical protein